jgi:hypothetical protein
MLSDSHLKPTRVSADNKLAASKIIAHHLCKARSALCSSFNTLRKLRLFKRRLGDHDYEEESLLLGTSNQDGRKEDDNAEAMKGSLPRMTGDSLEIYSRPGTRLAKHVH